MNSPQLSGAATWASASSMAAETLMRPKPYQLWYRKPKVPGVACHAGSTGYPDAVTAASSMAAPSASCSLVAVTARIYFTSRQVRFGLASSSNATTPLVTGAADDVPLKEEV